MPLVSVCIHWAAAVAMVFVQASPEDVALADLQQQDAQVASVGYALAHGNRMLCGDAVFLAGITPHYLAQYDRSFRDAAARRFALASLPSVLAVADGSPAARAGLRADDRLIAVDDTPFAAIDARTPSATYTDTERAMDLIDRSVADGRLALTIERAGTQSAIAIDMEQGCRSRFQVVPGEGLKAQADGAYIQISTGSVAFSRGEGELASVLAHELAHNILRHRVRLEAQGALRKGLFGPGARNARIIRATEIEADRLSPYLMANAGYDPRDAVVYWQRHGRERGDRWFRTGTHPKWRERIAIIETEVMAIERARAAGETARLPPDLSVLVAPPHE